MSCAVRFLRGLARLSGVTVRRRSSRSDELPFPTPGGYELGRSKLTIVWVEAVWSSSVAPALVGVSHSGHSHASYRQAGATGQKRVGVGYPHVP
jgi:hypothetical protein